MLSNHSHSFTSQKWSCSADTISTVQPLPKVRGPLHLLPTQAESRRILGSYPVNSPWSAKCTYTWQFLCRWIGFFFKHLYIMQWAVLFDENCTCTSILHEKHEWVTQCAHAQCRTKPPQHSLPHQHTIIRAKKHCYTGPVNRSTLRCNWGRCKLSSCGHRVSQRQKHVQHLTTLSHQET